MLLSQLSPVFTKTSAVILASSLSLNGFQEASAKKKKTGVVNMTVETNEEVWSHVKMPDVLTKVYGLLI